MHAGHTRAVAKAATDGNQVSETVEAKESPAAGLCAARYSSPVLLNIQRLSGGNRSMIRNMARDTNKRA
jgi:hypothetical protein